MRERDPLTAFSPGANLWLIPPFESSAWSKRIDWYLGFQICRAKPYRRFEFGPDMRQLTEAFEGTMPKIARTEDAALMVASETRLPNRQTVVVPVCENPHDWILGCHRIWQQLAKPSLRIFLLDGLAKSTVETAWPEPSDLNDVEIISRPPL